jgi:hypothetical protein
MISVTLGNRSLLAQWDRLTSLNLSQLFFLISSIRQSPFMESKSKRDINEFYGVTEAPPASPDGNRRELIHHAKTRTLLPTTPYGLINMSQKDMNTLGVTATLGTPDHQSGYPRSPPKKNPSIPSPSLHSQSRPHTSGAVFGKSSAEPIPSGVPPNVHFIRIQQSSGPIIIPVRVPYNPQLVILT